MKKALLVSLFIPLVSLFAAGQLKEPLTGLACRDFKRIQSTDNEVMKNITAIIVQLNWSDVQPKENGPIQRNNDLDEAIKWVQSFKEKYGVTIGLKVRLYCGYHSPDWLINKVGYFEAKSERIPKFWKEDFVAAFADVQKKLAEIYDNVPEVHEVVDGGTSVTTAEALIRPFKQQGAKAEIITNLFRNAGYTAEADSIAIVKSFDAMKAWKKTLVSVCFSNWKTLDKNGNTLEDINKTFNFIRIFVSKFGKQAVIGNNGLRPEIGKHGQRWQEGGDMYALSKFFKKIHDEQNVQIYFQTASDQRLGDLQQAIKDGIAYGASYIELPGAPRDYMADLPPSAMSDLKKKLEANLRKS